MVKSESGADQQISSYEYDAGNRLTKASDASGASDEKRKIDSEVSYDTFDQPIKTRLRKSGDANWTFSTMAYDLGGNVERRVDDGEEQTDGTNVKAGRKHEFTYDGADWLAEHLDHGKKSADTETADDRRITNTWLPTGWEKGRRIERRNGSGWETKQTTDWTYFQNGLLRTLLTKNGQGAVKESHDVSYIDNGVYLNGNRTKDVFRLDGPKADAPCKTADCTLLYTYDPRDRLVKEEKQLSDGRNKVTSFELDPAGNITKESRPDGTTISSDYNGQQLDLQTISKSGVSEQQKYHYDSEGNLDCITKPDIGSCPLTDGYAAGVFADYRYDLLNRLVQMRSWDRAGQLDDEARYIYDALDRIVEQTDRHGDGNATEDGGFNPEKTTVFSYVGLTSDVAEEERREGGTATGALDYTKAYSYDSFGHRVAMSRQNYEGGSPSGEEKQFTYGHDVHGSVSLLLDEATGNASAQYGYTPYGEKDKDLSQEQDPDSPTGGLAKETEPLNSYRYSAKRLDPGSGTLDMGARRFGPQTGLGSAAAFLQADRYDGALDNLGLSEDPLTANRYSLAGGNPVSFVEVDGHHAVPGGRGRAARAGRCMSDAACTGGYKHNHARRNINPSGDAPLTDAAASNGYEDVVDTKATTKAARQDVFYQKVKPAIDAVTPKEQQPQLHNPRVPFVTPGTDLPSADRTRRADVTRLAEAAMETLDRNDYAGRVYGTRTHRVLELMVRAQRDPKLHAEVSWP